MTTDQARATLDIGTSVMTTGRAAKTIPSAGRLVRGWCLGDERSIAWTATSWSTKVRRGLLHEPALPGYLAMVGTEIDLLDIHWNADDLVQRSQPTPIAWEMVAEEAQNDWGAKAREWSDQRSPTSTMQNLMEKLEAQAHLRNATGPRWMSTNISPTLVRLESERRCEGDQEKRIAIKRNMWGSRARNDRSRCRMCCDT